jgi:hypothetical protein
MHDILQDTESYGAIVQFQELHMLAGMKYSDKIMRPKLKLSCIAATSVIFHDCKMLISIPVLSPNPHMVQNNSDRLRRCARDGLESRDKKEKHKSQALYH